MKNLIDWLYGISVAVLLFIVVQQGVNIYRSYEPTSNWFNAIELTIPNFNVGDDPVITYSRVIEKEIQGRWLADVQKITEDGTISICTSEGVALYEPDKVLPDEVTLSWLLQDSCHIDKGTYRVEVKWEFDIPNYPDHKYETIKSNIFTVQ